MVGSIVHRFPFTQLVQAAAKFILVSSSMSPYRAASPFAKRRAIKVAVKDVDWMARIVWASQ